ncbi:unnamed protein product [Linum tenue]|uniref:Axial regulator YABBY 4 n=1 Tax=Linum tenue TaxID=586396 RepID=A0AAV0LMK7_9ROSI|nr:unnamed protein product [Linum tenue]
MSSSSSTTTLSQLFDLPAGEQICYVQCGFCTTILLVSVPCSSMSMVVTVRCGHCTSLLSVNMMKASFVPFHLLAASLPHHDHNQDLSPHHNHQQQEEAAAAITHVDNEEEDQDPTVHLNRIINKPPEKRQRAPSAYNRFIKEEIKRLKADNPKMAHKEAFSMAAKNWAHFPPAIHREDGDDDEDEDEIGFKHQRKQQQEVEVEEEEDHRQEPNTPWSSFDEPEEIFR